MKKGLRSYGVLTLFVGMLFILSGCAFYEKKAIIVENVNKTSGVESFIENYNKNCNQIKEENGIISKKEKEENPTLKITYGDKTEDARLIMYSKKKKDVKFIKEENINIIKGNEMPVYTVSPEEKLKLNFSRGDQKYIGFCVLDSDKGIDLDERMFATKAEASDYIKAPERKGNYIIYIFSGWEEQYTIYESKLKVQ